MGKKTNQKSGKWNKTEHQKFMKALVKYGKNWSMIQKCVQTRTLAQVRSHAQKLFLGMSQQQLNNFQHEINHRQDMFCNIQKNKKQKKQSKEKFQPQCPQNPKQQVQQIKIQHSEKPEDDRIPQCKKVIVCQPKPILTNQGNGSPFINNIPPVDHIKASILQTCLQIQVLHQRLNQNSNFLMNNFPMANIGSLNPYQISLLQYLNWMNR